MSYASRTSLIKTHPSSLEWSFIYKRVRINVTLLFNRALLWSNLSENFSNITVLYNAVFELIKWNSLMMVVIVANEARWNKVLFSSSSSSSSVICQTTGPKPLPERFLHIVRSRASSFNWQYPLLSLTSSSSFVRLLPRLLITSICPFIFPWITCCRRQFLRKMWPIQLAFRFLISCRIFLCSLTLRFYFIGTF